MATNNTDLFSFLPGLELSENEILEAELSAQQLLKAKYPDIDLREGTAIRDLVIRPSATLLALINKALIFYFSQNDISGINNSTPQEFVDKIMSNWFLQRKVGIQAVLNARLFFAKAKNISLYSDIFFSTDGTLKFSPLTSVTYASPQLTFDSNSNQYYIDIDLIAEKPGVEYNIASGSLLYFSNFDPYFLHAEINFLKEAADDVETNEEFISRARSAISTRNNINVPSISANLTDYFTYLKKVLTIGYGDPEMTRDQIKVVVPGVTDPIWFHNGGAADVYCRVPVASAIVQLTSDSTGKIGMTGSVYKFQRSIVSGGTLDDTIPYYTTKSVTSITRSGTTATVTCTGHGYTSGTTVHITGASPAGYNGDFVITSTGTDTFTYPVPNTLTTPATGAITSGVPTPYTWVNSYLTNFTATSITRSGTTATVTYANHGLMVGDRIEVSGASQPDYNGVFLVSAVLDRNTLTYVVANNPATPATGTILVTFVDRINDVGFSDRQSLTLDFGGGQTNKTASFLIYYHQNLDSIQAYLDNKDRRVICADLLGRGFNLAMLDFTITAYNGPTPDATLANNVCIDYLAGLGPGEPFIMSDLLAKLYTAGITTIQTPIGVTYTKYWNDLLNTTAGTIIDALDPNDSCNLFMVNSVTTTNEPIV